MKDWCVVYDDYSTFDPDDGTALDAPGYGVAGIIVPNEKAGAQVVFAGSHYIWREDAGTWQAVDEVGLNDYLVNILKTVKIGRGVPSYEKWEELLAWMKDNKSALLRGAEPMPPQKVG